MSSRDQSFDLLKIAAGLLVAIVIFFVIANRPLVRDTSKFADMKHYQAANRLLGDQADRVVFIGDSITDFWNLSSSFPGQPYVNRGIAGQASSQILLRFHQDVIDLHPKAVVILTGINDLGGVAGPMELEQIQSNYEAMLEIARSHQIKVIFGSLLPVSKIHAHKHPSNKILALNAWLRSYCVRSGAIYLDYFSRMVDEDGLLRRELSDDGLHPNAKGYGIMASSVEAAMNEEAAFR